MQLATVREAGGTQDAAGARAVEGAAAVLDPERGVVLLRDLADPFPGGVLDVLGALTPAQLAARVAATGADRFSPPERWAPLAPYTRPRKIWGIGLNYRKHADDLDAAYPDEPASFLKADHTIIGQGDPIPLPAQSDRVTAEAELGLVIGRTCRNVRPDQALEYVWGVCPVLDQTAEDILQRNPRFLTRAKNFPGFFSFGPAITPLDEVLERFGELGRIEVATVRNGGVHRSNTVSDMLFDPELLISFHSRVMPLFPGDVLSTGTPGAVVIRDGDVAQCRIPGIGTLTNPVVGADRAAAAGG